MMLLPADERTFVGGRCTLCYLQMLQLVTLTANAMPVSCCWQMPLRCRCRSGHQQLAI